MFRNRIRNTAIALSLFFHGFAGAAGALPILSEVFYDASGSDNGTVFVELYGAAGTPLDGLVVEGVNGSGGGVGPVLALSGSIPQDGIFVLADDRGDGGTDVANADLILNFDFQNGPDSIVLRDAGSVLDAVGYGEFAAGDVFAGEGTAATDPPAGSSLARHFANVDTGDNAADFGVALPTPGSVELFAVPEPRPLVLAAGFLVALLALRRRAGGAAA